MTRKERALRNLKQMCSDGRYLGSGSYIPLEVLEDFSTAIKALEQEPTTKIEESNFSQEQYKADLQSAYDCGLKRLLSQDDYCLVSVASVKRALEQETRWIPVSERLPQLKEQVLCCEKDKVFIGRMVFEYDGVPVFSTLRCDYYYYVTAWMPLPQPYREVEE